LFIKVKNQPIFIPTPMIPFPRGVLFRVQGLRVVLGSVYPFWVGEFMAQNRCRFHLLDYAPLVTKIICSLASSHVFP
jgi:hypothetical protein